MQPLHLIIWMSDISGSEKPHITLNIFFTFTFMNRIYEVLVFMKLDWLYISTSIEISDILTVKSTLQLLCTY
jgi:hypothetical protein